MSLSAISTTVGVITEEAMVALRRGAVAMGEMCFLSMVFLEEA